MTELKKKIKNILDEVVQEKNLVVESSISRVWQHMEQRKPFAFVSASRASMDNKEKLNAYSTLKKKVRELGYGYIETKGGYVEQGDDEQGNEVIDELSLMIPNITAHDAVKLGDIDFGHGSQDTVLYCNGDNFLGYIATNPAVAPVGSVVDEFQYGKGKDALPMAKEAVSKYFSMLSKGRHRKRKFAFVPKDFQMYEMRDRRYPTKPGDWWDNFGVRIL